MISLGRFHPARWRPRHRIIEGQRGGWISTPVARSLINLCDNTKHTAAHASRARQRHIDRQTRQVPRATHTHTQPTRDASKRFEEIPFPATVATSSALSEVCRSQEESAKASTERQETILKEQACANAIYRKQWKKAIYLAFELRQPRKLLGVLTEMLDAGPGSRQVHTHSRISPAPLAFASRVPAAQRAFHSVREGGGRLSAEMRGEKQLQTAGAPSLPSGRHFPWAPLSYFRSIDYSSRTTAARCGSKPTRLCHCGDDVALDRTGQLPVYISSAATALPQGWRSSCKTTSVPLAYPPNDDNSGKLP